LQHTRNVMIYVRRLFNEVDEYERVLKVTVGVQVKVVSVKRD
jgi:hypothetical protein